MTQPIDLKFEYTEHEYIGAVRRYYMYARKIKLNLILSLLITLVGFFIEHPFLKVFVIGSGIVILLVILIAYFILPMMIFHQSPSLQGKHQLFFSEEGIKFTSGERFSDMGWNIYHKVYESNNFYYLFYEKYVFTLVPKKSFKNEKQEEAFRKLIQENIQSDFVQI